MEFGSLRGDGRLAYGGFSRGSQSDGSGEMRRRSRLVCGR